VFDDQIYNQVSTKYSFLDPDYGQRLSSSNTNLVDDNWHLLDQVRTTLEDDGIDFTHDIFENNLTVKDENGVAVRFANNNEIERAARNFITNDGRHLYKETDAYRGDMRKSSNALLSVFGVL